MKRSRSMVAKGAVAAISLCAAQGSAQVVPSPVFPALQKPKPAAAQAATTPVSTLCVQLATAAIPAPAYAIAVTTRLYAKDEVKPTNLAPLPEHCYLHGNTGAKLTNSDGSTQQRGNVAFELRLPSQWNGQFFFEGGGGTDGKEEKAYGNMLSHDGASALNRGYAVVKSDSGHSYSALAAQSSQLEFGLDFQDRTDYAYRHIGLVTAAAKAYIKAYYAEPPKHSFFVGCSNGGRQGLLAATRFASEFDAVLAGAPGLNLSRAAASGPWAAKAMNAIVDAPWKALSFADQRIIKGAVLAACDALDGLTDNIVHDVKRCHTTVSALPQLCTADGCLADNKRQMLNKILSGPKSSAGTQLYGGAPWDPGLGTAQWRQWRVSAADGVVPYPAMTVFGGALAEIMSVPPSLLCDSGNIYPMNPDGTYGSGLFRPSAATCTPTMSVQWKYVSTLDVDTIYGLTHTTNAFFPESGASQIDVPDPANLSAFKARGGKLITFTGTADPLVSVDEITSWYDDVLRRDANATNYTAYYLVPGMNHCYGGQSMDKFNLFDTLESWVWRQDNSGLPVALNERPWASTRACANSVDYLESYAGDGPCNAGLTGVTTNVTRELCRYPKVLRVAPGSSAFTCTAP